MICCSMVNIASVDCLERLILTTVAGIYSLVLWFLGVQKKSLVSTVGVCLITKTLSCCELIPLCSSGLVMLKPSGLQLASRLPKLFQYLHDELMIISLP